MIVESLLCDVIRNLEQPRGEKWVRDVNITHESSIIFSLNLSK